MFPCYCNLYGLKPDVYNIYAKMCHTNKVKSIGMANSGSYMKMVALVRGDKDAREKYLKGFMERMEQCQKK